MFAQDLVLLGTQPTTLHERRTVEAVLHDRSMLASPLGEDHERLTGFDHLDARAKCLTVS